MRKRLASVCFLVATSVFCIGIHICYAGNINGNEEAVISAASGVFEYDGVSYKAKPGYVAALKSKLSEDDVNLTAEQSQKAITAIYANVGVGVAQGYLIPVNGSKKAKIQNNPDKGHTNHRNSGTKQELKPELEKKEKAENKSTNDAKKFENKNLINEKQEKKDKQTKDKNLKLAFTGSGIIILFSAFWLAKFCLKSRLKRKGNTKR